MEEHSTIISEIAKHNEEVDFDMTCDGAEFRCIRDDKIDGIQQEELGSDLYALGMFAPWFLSDVLGIGKDVITLMQEADAYDALGKLIVDLGKLEHVQQQYARLDGYGHHFAHYDSIDTKVTVNGRVYHVFRIG